MFYEKVQYQSFFSLISCLSGLWAEGPSGPDMTLHRLSGLQKHHKAKP